MRPALPGIVVGLTGLGRGPQAHAAFARRAVELGYGRIWLPETFLLDPVAFAGWLAATVPGHPVGLGVLPSPLRSGAQLAMTAATLAALGVDDLVIALGSSSPRVLQRWHHRPAATVTQVEALLAEARAAAAGRTPGGFTNGLGPVDLRLHLAAFGPRMLRLAGRAADGVALNFIGPEGVAPLVASIDEGAAAAGRARPPITVWTHVSVDPDEKQREAGRRFVGNYLRVPGYDRVLALQGYADIVERAATLAPADAAALVSDDMLADILGYGDAAAVAERLARFAELGVDVALMPGAVRPGTVTERTLTALAPR